MTPEQQEAIAAARTAAALLPADPSPELLRHWYGEARAAVLAFAAAFPAAPEGGQQ